MVDMNIINPHYIRDYITQKFGDVGKLSANGVEFIMSSPYIENDWKRHFSINLDTGLWQDFKSGESGNFLKLYAYLENMSFGQAKTKLILDSFFLDAPKEYIPEKYEPEQPELVPVNIHSHESEDKLVQQAWSLLFERKLYDLNEEDPEPFYVCKEGRYKNRLIIPFKEDGKIYYFQARSLDGREPKYLNPESEIGVKPSEILYPYDESQDYVVVCEGPLDALSLQLQGVNATSTMGCHISRIQAEMLKESNVKIVLGFDNDEAGERGLKSFEKLRKELCMPTFHLCNLPGSYNDWNEAHVENFNLYEWITEKSQEYDFEYQTLGNL